MSTSELLRVGETATPQVTGKSCRSLSICFVTPLSLADFVDPDLTVKGSRYIMAGNVGILTLAALLRDQGYQPKIMNLDELFLGFLGGGQGRSTTGAQPGNLQPSAESDETRPPAPPTPEAFFRFIVDALRPVSADIFGFGSICSSYPLTIRLAQEVKRLHPHATIIVGGPQASVVDVPTMRAFPWIDYVVRAEAEHTLLALLERVSADDGPGELDGIAGLTFRRGEEIVRNRPAPVIGALDRLPLPAFDLDPDFMSRGSAYLEIGRGCPFACTFCSTNDFFRRNFRLKSTPKMLEEMRRVKQDYGLGNFSLIHDMYTIDRKKVIAFCDAMLAGGEDFTWACSARTDCIDDELIALMAKAGCRGIFFGIETGSERLQTVINKKLDLAEARKRIECADRHGIKIAVALITAFPDETRDDLRDTIHFFIDSLRLEHAEPQMSLLAPLAATPIHEEYKDRLVLDEIFSDMSHQGWQQDPADIELIRSHPDIFPNFYAVPTRWLDRKYFKEVRDFVTYVTTWFHWLPVALLQDNGDILTVFDRWKAWLTARHRDDADLDTGMIPYYCHRQFRGDFLEFVQTAYLEEMANAKAAIAALARAEELAQVIRTPESAAPERTEGFGDADFPFLEPNLLAMDLPVDYKQLIGSLRRNDRGLAQVPERSVTIVFRTKGGRRFQVWQLSQLSATLVRLCDGKRTVREIARDFAALERDVCGVPAESACRVGLALLQEEGLIGFSRRPLAGDVDLDAGDGPTITAPASPPPPQMSNTQQPWPWPAPTLAGGA